MATSVVLHPKRDAFSVGPPQVKVAQFSLIVSIQPISFVVLLATVQSSKQIVVESKTMDREFFDQTPGKQLVVLIEREVLRNAEGFIESCEHCNPERADLPFVVILDLMRGSDPKITDYVLEVAAKCPQCDREIFKKTLVEPA